MSQGGKRSGRSAIGSSDVLGKHKACDNCKRRKVRCNGGTPCQNCLRSESDCQYTSTHGRLAHSERRIVRLQERVRLIEAAWKRFLPNVSLSAALHTMTDLSTTDSPRPIDESQEPISLESQTSSRSDSNLFAIPPQQSENLDVASASQQEPDKELVDALDWDESAELTTAADGIGSLSVNSTGTGYMGPQSGNALLRNLQSISILYLSSHDEILPKILPSLGIPEHTLKSAPFRNQCIDDYFRYYHCAYPMLHEGYFRAQLMGALPKPKDGSWPILLNTVLAVGAHSGNLCNENADRYFCREALRNISWEILQRGTLSLVQALSLLANYLQKRNRPNSGFTLLGLAMNMAQGVGLHRELAGPDIGDFTMEVRRRVWWTLFIFDSGARVTFGRPTLSLGGVNTKYPSNLNDEDLTVDLDGLPEPSDCPTVTSSLIWQIKLAKIGNAANEELLESSVPRTARVFELEELISAWKNDLPPYMQGEFSDPEFEVFDVPRMVLLWRSMHLRIVIHRPFVLDLIKQRSILELTSPQTLASLCLAAANECVTSILAFWNMTKSHHGSLMWYACYWLVTAVLVHVTCLLYDPQHALSIVWRQHIEGSRVALESMGTSEPLAARAARIIERIMDLVPSSPDSTFFVTNEPIRMEVAELWNQSWVDLAVPGQDRSLQDLGW